MYSTCLFCNRALGSNEALEHFPVGRRLAFDSAKGRLWVICPSCTRWNLTPLEERWEAVEEAERLYRGTTLRVSTEHIGLARVADGTDLVRVGLPQRPELAAWRYGDQFIRRRKKFIVVAALTAIGGVAVIGGGLSAGLGVVTAGYLTSAMWRMGGRGFPLSTVARFHDTTGELVRVRRKFLRQTTIGAGSDGSFAINVPYGSGFNRARLEGEQAKRVAASLFPAVNRGGGAAADVQSAVERLACAGGVEGFLRETAQHGAELTRIRLPMTNSDDARAKDRRSGSGLLALSTDMSLAIEMALHEEQERRALEGELGELETAWREAEEIGAIADDLFLPSGVERALDRLRGRSS